MGGSESLAGFKLGHELTPPELEKLQVEFNNYDENHNNVLEHSELIAFLTNHMPELVNFSKVIMDMFGTGKKGTINFENFKVFYLSLKQIGIDEYDPTSFPMLIFSKLDKDNNFYINEKEIKYLWKLLRPKHIKKKVTKKEVKEIIHSQHPAREDWGLSRDEFIKLFDSFLTTGPTQADCDPNQLPQIYGGGLNKNHQISVNHKPTLPVLIETSVNANLRCIAAGQSHTVIITENCIVYGLGLNNLFQIGGHETEYIVPTALILHTKNLVWAACGENFTVYLNEEGKILFCGPVCRDASKPKPEPFIIEPEPKNPYVYLTASKNRFAAIDSSGKVCIFTSDPRQRPVRNTLPKPAYDVACGNSGFANKFFAVALTVDGQIYGYDALNRDLHHFAPIPTLQDTIIRRVFGYSHHLALLTRDGRAMTYGSGGAGQLGNGSLASNECFKLIKGNLTATFIDIAIGEEHTLFVTKDGQVFSCGNNTHFQLLLGPTKQPVKELTPTPLVKGTAVACACGSSHSIVLIDAKKINHPGMNAFGIKQI